MALCPKRARQFSARRTHGSWYSIFILPSFIGAVLPVTSLSSPSSIFRQSWRQPANEKPSNIELSCHPESEPHASLLWSVPKVPLRTWGTAPTICYIQNSFNPKRGGCFSVLHILEGLLLSVCVLQSEHLEISQFPISISYFLDPLQTDLSANISGHMVTED